jgi:hypothetical protein
MVIEHCEQTYMSEYKEIFQVENGVLHVQLSGKFPNELLQKEENLFQPLIDACSGQNCERALIDARELQVDFGTMALLRAGEDAALLNHIGLRVAILVREDMVDPFFDDVVTNRGGELGIFTDIETARGWIKQ